MTFRRTLVLGVLALSGLADRAMAQYPPNTYYPRPQQMQVPPYPYGQGFVPQPGYAPQPTYGQPIYVPSQMPIGPSPNMVTYPSSPVTPTRPMPSAPVVVPPGALATVPKTEPPTQAQPETVPTPPRSEPPAVEAHPPEIAVAAVPVDYDGPPVGRDQLERFYIQGGYVFVQPRWNNNPAFAVATVTPSAALVNLENPGGLALTGTGQRDFAFDWSLAPRVEIGGAFPGGFGLRTRWMYFDQTASDTLARPADTTLIVGATPLGLQNGMNTGESAIASARLHFHNVDFEAMQEWRTGPISVYGSAGLRYSYLQQNYDYLEANADGSSDTLGFSSYFNGLGPTISVETRRRFDDLGLSAFAVTRGSLLFGRYNQLATDAVPGFPTRTGRKDEEDVLPITELELGLEWSRRLSSGARLFLTFGGFGQLWMGAGNSSDSSPSFTQDPLGPGARLQFVDPNSQSRRDLGLVGLSMTVGIQF